MSALIWKYSSAHRNIVILRSLNDIIQTCWARGQSLLSSSGLHSTFQATEWAFPRSHTSSPSHPRQDSSLPRHARFMTCRYDANRQQFAHQASPCFPSYTVDPVCSDATDFKNKTKKRNTQVTHTHARCIQAETPGGNWWRRTKRWRAERPQHEQTRRGGREKERERKKGKDRDGLKRKADRVDRRREMWSK